METIMTDTDTTTPDADGTTNEHDPIPLATPYSDAVESYLGAATHLDLLDEPLKVHARALARSLDLQLNTKGEIQSALAGSFDKVMFRLDARRPKPASEAPQVAGQTTIFQHLDD